MIFRNSRIRSFSVRTIVPKENCPTPHSIPQLGLGLRLVLGAIFLGGNCPRTRFLKSNWLYCEQEWKESIQQERNTINIV